MPADFAGNSVSNARGLNLTSTPQTFTDWVGRRDKNDFYTFSLSGRSSFNLTLSGLSANADVQLQKSSGEVIAGSYNPFRRARRRQPAPNNNESISATLDAGTYYIRVYPVGGKTNTNYNLTVSGNEAPQSLEFSTDKSSYQVGETVSLTNTKVFDGNGVNDLARVDFELQKDGTGWQNISDAVNFSAIASDYRYVSFNYALSCLASGNYELRAQAFDKSGASSNFWQRSFSILDPVVPPVVPTKDWFEENIQDVGIRGEARWRFADNALDRNDMIAILRTAKDDYVVDETELANLRSLVSKAVDFGMPDYVRVLSNKIVNGDIANQNYQGNPLGNLYGGSSDIQIEKLIGKWFLGSDRPSTFYTYQYANGSLFQNGVSYQDVRQGELNNCFFLTGLAATAVPSPSTIENMFIDNGDGTFTVRFYRNKTAEYVTVDRYLPTNSSGSFVYANKGGSPNELWVAFAEKAYAQLNESGWSNPDSSYAYYATNSYKGIDNGGYMSDAFAQITGRSTASYRPLNDFNSVVNAFDSGQLIGLGTKSNNVASYLISGHAYTLLSYNASQQKLTLFNPWGIDNGSSKPGVLELAWSDIQANFSYWDSTITEPIPT
ncbi:MAG: C2 family cysteine protease [Heteroscytonema crispum UTEX LB 1556]